MGKGRGKNICPKLRANVADKNTAQLLDGSERRGFMAEGHNKREIPHRETHRTSNCPGYMFIMNLLCGHSLVLVGLKEAELVSPNPW